MKDKHQITNDAAIAHEPRLADARIIKFRAFDLDSSEMIFSEQDNMRDFYFDINAEKSLSLYMPKEEDFAEKRQAAIMQFTGFKDKNGKEIYEGDILSDWTETDEGMMQSFQTVFFEQSCGQWAVDYGHIQNRESWFALFDELKNFDYEVVGNVYENADLLAT